MLQRRLAGATSERRRTDEGAAVQPLETRVWRRGWGPNGCSGLPGGFYLFPGLAFGLAFGVLLLWLRRVRMRGAAVFAVASMLANAAAVIVWTIVFAPVASRFEGAGIFPAFALTGAIAGAVGGGLLGACTLRMVGARGWLRVTGAGAALGLLLYPIRH